MTSRENHFVPQFYLRSFSADGSRVNLFNFGQGRAIFGASIKHQCSRRNFYGFAPDLESALSRLEGATAEILRTIRTSRGLPTRGSLEWQTLLTFIVFQKLRTTNAGRMNDAMTDYFAKLWLEGNPELKHVDPNSFEMRNVYPTAIPLSVAEDLIPAADDLRPHLFVSESSAKFVTSDDPVVAHNQYCEGIDHRGVTGWNCRGLQIFWPISPVELLFIFDPVVYRVDKSHKGQHVTVLASDDIDQVNAVQILNAHHNVYFLDPNVVRQCGALASVRPSARHAFVETEAVLNLEGGTSSLVHTFSPLLPAKVYLSTVSIRKKAKQVPLHARGDLYRNAVERRANLGLAGRTAPAGRYAIKHTIRK